MTIRDLVFLFGLVACLQSATPLFCAPQDQVDELDAPANHDPDSKSRPRYLPPQEYQDVNYWRDGPGDAASHTLDVYPAKSTANAPILVFIHGGAWKLGKKEQVQEKPEALNREGICFVSLNYRLHPDGNYQDQATDIAKALAWVQQNAHAFHADPEQIVLMGHSAGAHLAALVAIDDRYLSRVHLTPAILRGVILLDGAGYNIPEQIKGTIRRRSRIMYESIFTTDIATQEDASPITHVAADRGTPPFLMFYVDHRWDSKNQSQNLAAKLQEVGVKATVLAAENKSHVTINREFGHPGDKVTAAALAFLGEVCGGH